MKKIENFLKLLKKSIINLIKRSFFMKKIDKFRRIKRFHLKKKTISPVIWINDTEGLILLRNNERFGFFGTITIIVLKGTIEILGYEFLEKNCEKAAFSEEITSFPDENPLEIFVKNAGFLNEEILGFLKQKFKESHQIIEDISQENQKEKFAIILFKSASHDFQGFYKENTEENIVKNPKILKFKIFPLKKKAIFSKQKKSIFPYKSSNSSQKPAISSQKPPISFNISHENLIDSIIKTLESFPKDSHIRTILIFGEKNTGKSTLCNYIINKLLSSHRKVAFLDTDLNKSFEFPASLTLYHVKKPVFFNRPCENQIKNSFRRNIVKFIGETSSGFFLEIFLKSLKNLSQKIAKSHENLENNDENLEITEENLENNENNDENRENNGKNRYKTEKETVFVINTQGYLKEIAEIVLLDIIRVLKPFFLISCGENAVYTTLKANSEGKLSLLKENSGFNIANFELFLIEKPRCEFRRFHLKNHLIYQYFVKKSLLKTSKREIPDKKWKLMEKLVKLPGKETPCYLNLSRFSHKFTLDITDKKVLFLNESPLISERFLCNFLEIPLINSIEFSIVALYKGENHWICEENSIEERDCIGFGYIQKVDFLKKNVEILLSEEFVNKGGINDIGLFVKSSLFGFSKEFYLGFYEEIMGFNEILEDFGEKTIEIPFVAERFEAIGEKAYVQRIANRRYNK